MNHGQSDMRLLAEPAESGVTKPDRRDQIIRAAWKLAADAGLTAVTIRSIARELGFTTGVVMHHFLDKEEIVREMVERLHSKLRIIYLRAASTVDADQRVEAMLLAALPQTDQTAFGWKLSISLQAEVLHSAKIAEIFQRYGQTFEDDIVDALSRVDDSASPESTRLAASYLVALVEGIGTQFTLRPGAMLAPTQTALVRAALSALPI